MENYSQLKATLALFKASLKASFRDPSSVAFGLLFPIIFILVFGFIGGGGSRVSVAIAKDTDTNNPIYKALDEIESINFITDKPEDEVRKSLEKGTIEAVLYIKTIAPTDTNPMPSYEVNVTTSTAAPQDGALFKSIVSGITDKVNLGAARIENPAVKLNTDEVSGRKFKTIDFILPGQLGFSLLSTGVFATAFVFFNLRQTLVLKRFFVTPIKKVNIIVAEGLSRLCFAIIQATLIILVGHFFFGFTLVHGFTTLLSMLVLSALGLIVFMGFGFVVSGTAKSENSIPPIANLVTLPQFLLAGTFFAVEAFPKWLQPVSKVLPLTYLNNAMRKVAFEGASLLSVSREIGILIVWGIVIYAASTKFFKWE
jgi:ABC-2 type transport system permease protein